MKYVTKTPTTYPPCDVNSLSYVTGRRGNTVGSELALQSGELLKPSPTTFIFHKERRSRMKERNEINIPGSVNAVFPQEMASLVSHFRSSPVWAVPLRSWEQLSACSSPNRTIHFSSKTERVICTGQRKASHLLTRSWVESAEHILGEAGRDGGSKRFSALCQSF